MAAHRMWLLQDGQLLRGRHDAGCDSKAMMQQAWVACQRPQEVNGRRRRMSQSCDDVLIGAVAAD